MLEFIVLGQIPGTNVQISFDLFIKLALLVVASSLIYIELFKIRSPRRRKEQTPELVHDQLAI